MYAEKQKRILKDNGVPFTTRHIFNGFHGEAIGFDSFKSCEKAMKLLGEVGVPSCCNNGRWELIYYI